MSKEETALAPRRDAALVNLRTMLAEKKRGDRITAAEIVESTGMPNWESFRSVICRFIRGQGMVPIAVKHDGYQIGTANNHVDEAEAQRRRALKNEAKGLRALVAAPRAEMDDAHVRRAEFLIVRSASRVQQSEQHDREIRKELKLGERAPLKLLNAR